jgi:hypothetical protein
MVAVVSFKYILVKRFDYGGSRRMRNLGIHKFQFVFISPFHDNAPPFSLTDIHDAMLLKAQN